MSKAAGLPRDQRHRDRIERDFDRNLLVEAGAGSGKTHSLARRMAAGIEAGAYEIEHMAAVTFTRKAAAELRGRFQLALEERLRDLRSGSAPRIPDPGSPIPDTERLNSALGNLERFFAGTIHSFCAHLLRERPVESGIAPGFTELDEAEDARMREESWRDYVTLAKASGKPELLELLDAGVRARDLDEAFKVVCLYEEVEFPAVRRSKPDIERAWEGLRKFWTALEKLMPRPPDPDSKCKALDKAFECRRLMRVINPSNPQDVVRILELWQGSSLKVTYKWWPGNNGRAAQALLETFRSEVVQPFLVDWREYIYGLAVAVLVEARAHAAGERRRHNKLNYADLLQMAARVLRGNADVRRALQRKYRWLFVDEFQDTDPVQAEIVFLLAADESADEYRAESGFSRTWPALPVTAAGAANSTPEAPSRQNRIPHPGSPAFARSTSARYGEASPELGAALSPAQSAGGRIPDADWRAVPLRPGALFVVGDPKQSIYRFRRADIDIYSLVKGRILASDGEVVPLTANFRSVETLCGWANDVFRTLFPASATQHAPAFERLDAFRSDRDERRFGVRTLSVPDTVEARQVSEHEAQSLARFIRSEVDGGRRKFGDFLLLTRKKKPLAVYARVLEGLGIPVEVSGAGAFGESEEVQHLAILLRALADPQDAVSLVGVLRGPFFGLSDPELFAYVRSGGRLWLFDALADGESLSASDPPLVAPGPHPVRTALIQLRQMYRWIRILPPAAAVERILEGSGYLALATTMGRGAEAGDLLHAIDRIRQAAEDGSTLMDAVESLEEDAEAGSEIDSLPLEPGRRDVVRLMNLHKAKGLEADVVFLADPLGGFDSWPDVRIVRDGASASGYFQLRVKFKNGGARVLGQPRDWDQHKGAEQQYLNAEGNRLLYVAATRARDLLVVGRYDGRARGTRAWTAFGRWLTHAPELKVPATVHTAPEPSIDMSPAVLAQAASARSGSIARALASSWSVTSVTAEARHISRVVRQAEGAADDPTTTIAHDRPAHRADAGMAWGTLIHGLLEHAMRHASATREDLRRLAMWLTVEEPQLRLVLDDAVEAVLSVSGADFWLEARQADHAVETPFSVAIEPARLLSGVIDLLYRSGDKWSIVDYKSDVMLHESALQHYQRQLAFYMSALEACGLGNVEASLQPVRAGAFGGGEASGSTP